MGKQIVYFIRMKHTNYIKIGVATNLKQRLAQLQCGNPCELEVLKKYDTNTPFENENNLHWLYRYHKIKNEWYNIDKYELIKADKYFKAKNKFNYLLNYIDGESEINERQKRITQRELKHNLGFGFLYKNPL